MYLNVNEMVVLQKLSPDEAANYDGLEHKSYYEALKNIKQLFIDWEPWYEAVIFNNGANLASASGCLSGLLYSRHFR